MQREIGDGEMGLLVSIAFGFETPVVFGFEVSVPRLSPCQCSNQKTAEADEESGSQWIHISGYGKDAGFRNREGEWG